MLPARKLFTHQQKNQKEKIKEYINELGQKITDNQLDEMISSIEEEDYSDFQPASATSHLQSIFSDADRKLEAAGVGEPTIESIVEFCNSIKQQRSKEAAELR